jgi:hypothetical protein
MYFNTGHRPVRGVRDLFIQASARNLSTGLPWTPMTETGPPLRQDMIA